MRWRGQASGIRQAYRPPSRVLRLSKHLTYTENTKGSRRRSASGARARKFESCRGGGVAKRVWRRRAAVGVRARRECVDWQASGSLGAVTAFPGIISAQTVTNAIKVGLIGCGGRGSGAASQALNADDYAELTALADIDQGNIDKCLASLKRTPKTGDKVKVD